MSTASISVQQGDKIKTIQVTSGGDITDLGATLLQHYNDQGRADALVSLGDAAYISESIYCPSGHSYDHPAQGHSVFYGRDRRESDTQPREYKQWSDVLVSECQEYNYLFDNGNWYCSDGFNITILDNKLCGISEQNSIDTLIESINSHVTELDALINSAFEQNSQLSGNILNKLNTLSIAIKKFQN